MLLALDAMGGDWAPIEPCKGAICACQQDPSLEIALVGDIEKIAPIVDGKEAASVRSRLHLIHASEAIGMGELPVEAMRKKRHSSLRLCMEMVRAKEADGCISAGNTGAIVAGGILVVGRIPGVDRPALGAPIPALERVSFLLDVGATVRCKSINLVQFAMMGSIYMKFLIGTERVKVALLSNGEEEIKGDDVVSEARDFLRHNPFDFDFVGYVEGKDIPFGKVDVVVCNGFTGNALLKFAEGVGEALRDLMKEEFQHRFLPKLGLPLMVPMLKSLWARFNYEQYGGTPLLGVNGTVVKAHGRSKAPAIGNALRVASRLVEHNGVEHIKNELAKGGN